MIWQVQERGGLDLPTQMEYCLESSRILESKKLFPLHLPYFNSLNMLLSVKQLEICLRHASSDLIDVSSLSIIVGAVKLDQVVWLLIPGIPHTFLFQGYHGNRLKGSSVY